MYVGSGVGGAGHHLFLAVHGTGVDDTVEAGALSAVVHLWEHIDVVLRGAGLCPGVAGLCPGARVHHYPGLQWSHNLHERTAGQGPSPKAQMERKALYLTGTVLQIQAEGENFRES